MSILLVFSKIFEKLLLKQLLVFFDNTSLRFLCGFKKEYGTQNCLLLMIEFFKDATYKDKAFGMLLTDP